MNLYDLDAHLDELQRRLDEVNLLIEETKPLSALIAPSEEHLALLEEKQAIEGTMESLNFDMEELMEQMAKGIRNLEADYQSYKNEELYFNKKKKNAEYSIKARKAFMKYIMEKHGQKSVKAGNFTVSIRNNGGKLPLSYMARPEDFPDDFRIVETVIKPNDTAIRAFLDAGGESELFKYEPRGQNLQIK